MITVSDYVIKYTSNHNGSNTFLILYLKMILYRFVFLCGINFQRF